MKLLLDLGNTRLKWGLAELAHSATAGVSSCLTQRGSVDYDDAALAAWAASLPWADVQQLRYASVVSAAREQAVLALLSSAVTPERIRVTPGVGNLSNAYASQETLGVDRWVAAIGAWSLVQVPCLVIGAGTATTIDLIESPAAGQGVYRGGLILPGIELMHQSLHQGTARLPATPGRYRPAPDVADNTQDAITSGVYEATCGAIERMSRRLSPDTPWLITGGNAAALMNALGAEAAHARVVDDLVLEGLAQI